MVSLDQDGTEYGSLVTSSHKQQLLFVFDFTFTLFFPPVIYYVFFVYDHQTLLNIRARLSHRSLEFKFADPPFILPLCWAPGGRKRRSRRSGVLVQLIRHSLWGTSCVNFRHGSHSSKRCGTAAWCASQKPGYRTRYRTLPYNYQGSPCTAQTGHRH